MARPFLEHRLEGTACVFCPVLSGFSYESGRDFCRGFSKLAQKIMDWLIEIGKYAGGAGVVAAVFFSLVKMGLLKVHIGKNGNGDKNEARFVDLEGHAKIANEEMAEVKEDISEMRTDIAVVKNQQETNTKTIDRIESSVDAIKNHLMK